jgi:D-3-phosphoglycerate dehydrogenase
VRPKEVTAKAIANAKNLKLIIRGGAGVNSIALSACKERGIIVENTPGLNSDATAEFAFYSMLKIIREAEQQTELHRKHLGIIGYGNIGKRMEKIATGFGMQTSVFKRGCNLHEFLKQQHDILSLHLPLTQQTTNILGAAEFALVKRGVIIINTARPQLIEPAAFQNALKSGIISRFAIDGDDDLLPPYQHPNGLLTPHIADSTLEAQANIARTALTQMLEFVTSGKEINRVI